MKKINKNNRYVATVKTIKYDSFKLDGITTCNVSIFLHYQNRIIFAFNVTGTAKSKENKENYDLEFGKKLARAKAERAMYIKIKLQLINSFRHNIYSCQFDTDEQIKENIIAINTIKFCNKMIKHQMTYINKLIKDKFPND